MAKFGEISWKVGKPKEKSLDELQTERKAPYSSFLDFFHKQHLNKKTIKFCHDLEKEYECLEKAIFSSEAIFRKIPLLSAFFEWVKKVYSNSKEKIEDAEEIEDAKLLLKYGFIGLKDSEGNTWTLHHASKQDPNEIYDAIRCRRELSLVQRERLVVAYKRFLNYLNFRTHGFIPNIWADNERSFIREKDLKPAEFAKFADHLNDNMQLVAKLLYYGGERILEEILNLEINQIDFKEQTVLYDYREPISYPAHVFADIKNLIKKRPKGRVFVGRHNAALNRSMKCDPTFRQ